MKSSDLLLDVESTYGQGVYHPELNEPEYSNAGNTALWELCALQVTLILKLFVWNKRIIYFYFNISYLVYD